MPEENDALSRVFTVKINLAITVYASFCFMFRRFVLNLSRFISQFLLLTSQGVSGVCYLWWMIDKYNNNTMLTIGDMLHLAEI